MLRGPREFARYGDLHGLSLSAFFVVMIGDAAYPSALWWLILGLSCFVLGVYLVRYGRELARYYESQVLNFPRFTARSGAVFGVVEALVGGAIIVLVCLRLLGAI